MPTDNRRNQGPESSTPYLLYVNCKEKEYTDYVADIVSKDGTRKDGRKWDEQRRIYMKTGIISQAKGSAYIEQGNTKVVCSVFDPRETPRKSEYSVNGELYCEFKYAPFSCKVRRGHQSDAEEKEYSLILRRALEPAVCRHEFPNFQVDVYALVLENDGSGLPAAITCAGLALADASVPMYDLVTATSLGIHGDLKFIDPCVEETSLCNTSPREGNKNHGIITVAYSPMHQQICEFVQYGMMNMDCITSSISLLTKACENIHPLSQQCLVKSVTKALMKKKKTEARLDMSSDRIGC
ncbi:exosome complex component MTR3 [Anabrus simplex]|uniref:exosome complex component MTR3 n=1 Tax=Anabrus simplex TaxID=316456 RepID=UPI0035A26E8E